MKRIAPILTVLVWLVFTATAVASKHHTHKQHPPTDPVTLALKLAEGYWGATPCKGQISIKDEVLNYSPTAQSGVAASGLANGELEPTMQSEWSNANGNAVECVTTLNSHLWPNWYIMDRHFQLFCDEMTHELGHYLGHKDDGQTNPASIEYPILGETSPNYDSVPQCQHATLFYGHEEFDVVPNGESWSPI